MLEEYRNTQVNQTSRLNEPNIRSDILVTNRILKLLGHIEGKRILELGSGNGKVARMLHEAGAHVMAVDAVSEQVSIAQENSPSEIQYLHADFSSKDFLTVIPPGPYDRILSVMSIFYSSSTEIVQTLENVRKLLAPNGLLIIGTASPYRGLKKEGFDYFKEQGSGVVLPSKTSEPFTTNYIHLPLAFLITACIKSGFSLSQFIEPHATVEEVEQYPEILSERDTLVPDYLILEFKVAG